MIAGLGAPIWYINRVEKDEERLEELRALNRANFEATGEYMNDVSAWGSCTCMNGLLCWMDGYHCYHMCHQSAELVAFAARGFAG